jgi:hypothetical protein
MQKAQVVAALLGQQALDLRGRDVGEDDAVVAVLVWSWTLMVKFIG